MGLIFLEKHFDSPKTLHKPLSRSGTAGLASNEHSSFLGYILTRDLHLWACYSFLLYVQV